MRVRAAAAVVGLAVVGSSWVPQAVARPAHAARALPKLITRSYSGIRPRDVYFSGDAGNIVTGLRWQWGRSSAVGRGTSNIQGCVPNCAQGTETPVVTNVTFSRPERGHFTKVVEIRDHQTVVGFYGGGLWPEGAR